MYSKLAVLAALYNLVAADVSGATAAASSADSILKDLDSQVQSWDSAAGLQGALGIQGGIPSLTAAIAALSSQLPDTVSNDDAKTIMSALAPLAGTISTLLKDLTDKAADFEAVGAASIVKGDINQLSGPAADVVSKAVGALPSDVDSDVVNSASSLISQVSDGFASGASAYSASTVEWPTVAAAGGAGASAEASDSAMESASATESASAEASDSAVESASATESASAEASDSAVESASAKESASAESSASGKASSSAASSAASSTKSESSSSASSSNAGALTSYGVGAAVAGAIAMLL